ncbi:MAG: hypothetical protein K9K75_04190 [Deltaproteobacteria bacterium]|nr:hypothetical protein [Deltaproteobacteria bacterium]
MKKVTVLLLAAAFVIGFALTASAADVKLGGQYYVRGFVEDNHALGSKDNAKTKSAIHQRLRVQPEVAIADGLKLVMRFDALEKTWGEKTWTGSSVDTASRPSIGAAGAAEQQSIEFERAYADFNTGIGKFIVGYQNFIAWGTSFGDTHATRAGLKYVVPLNENLIALAAFEKSTKDVVFADRDDELFDLGAVYKLPNGEAGLLYQYGRTASKRDYIHPTYGVPAGNVLTLNAFLPYYKGTFDNIYVEAEGLYAMGKIAMEPEVSPAVASDTTLSGFGLYGKVNVDLAPAYVGGVFAYITGDDITTKDKKEGGLATQLLYGQAWSPMVLMWNDQFMSASGAYSANGVTMNQFFDNAMLVYLYAGTKPMEKLDVKVAFAYALANQDVVAGQISKNIGMEFDVVATYSIYSNLNYEVGLGYFMPGDFFKGITESAELSANYLLYNKLTLNF